VALLAGLRIEAVDSQGSTVILEGRSPPGTGRVSRVHGPIPIPIEGIKRRSEYFDPCLSYVLEIGITVELILGETLVNRTKAWPFSHQTLTLHQAWRQRTNKKDDWDIQDKSPRH
jgi:hypothetical protein